VVRLQKFLAEAGVASRRASEQIIQGGRVAVNTATVTQMGTKIDPGHDRVTVDGRAIKPKRKLYLALHKPRGYICSPAADETRDKIARLLPEQWSDLLAVGRLDYNSEGLIFLTNDGDFCLKLTHPRYAIAKTYVAKIQGRVTPEILKRFTQGVVSAGEKVQARRARLVSASDSSSVVELELTEGKNREVRRLFESQNLTVRRLQRVRIGCIGLGQLRAGKWRRLTETEIKSLLQSV
jgi:23S rRNA pseudouridine2605 synthase